MTRALRVGLTQRADSVAAYGERRDALDQRWARLIEEAGHIPMPLSNDLRNPQGYVRDMKPDAIVLTGGNDIARLPGAVRPAAERDQLEEAVIRYAGSQALPLLAVCRGMQMLNLVLGGRVAPITGHVAVDHALAPPLNGLSSVNSFHDWGIPPDGLAADLLPLAYAADGMVEAARHRQLPWLAVMWHPERPIPEAPRQAALVAAVIEGRWRQELAL